MVGTDETTDLAVIKLDSTETLPFAALGNDLKIGQIVIYTKTVKVLLLTA